MTSIGSGTERTTARRDSTTEANAGAPAGTTAASTAAVDALGGDLASEQAAGDTMEVSTPGAIVPGGADPRTDTLVSTSMLGVLSSRASAAVDESDTDRPSLQCKRFGTEVFAAVAAGEVTLGPDSPHTEEIARVQASLYSLGHDSWPDSVFGPKTSEAITSFQQQAGLSPTGIVDAATLTALDKAAALQLSELKDSSLEAGLRSEQYKVVADLANSSNRIYVLDDDGEPVARYLTAPGKTGWRTPTWSGEIDRTLVRQWWNPTPRMRERGITEGKPPGVDNPMGLVKQHLFKHIYIHGVPKAKEASLGRAASSGCLRMSASNILELSEKYVERGSSVEISRDAELSARLAARAEAAGLQDQPLDSGRAYLAAYAYGEMGHNDG